MKPPLVLASFRGVEAMNYSATSAADTASALQSCWQQISCPWLVDGQFRDQAWFYHIIYI